MADRPGLTGAFLPYQAPAMDNPFTTPGDQQRQRISAGFGWDVGQPMQEFLRRLPLLLQTMPTRSPMGAKMGNDAVWAARTPSAITGGRPMQLPELQMLSPPPIAQSSTGLIARNPGAFERNPGSVPGHTSSGMMRDITPTDMGFSGPSVPANSLAGARWRYLQALEDQRPGRNPFGVIPGGRK